MIKLDENLLVELGLQGLPKEEKSAFLKHMYETLEMRVGTRLAERMSEQQMSEFEQFISSNDEQGAFHWLETNFPNYKEVVAEEFEKLKHEIAPMAPQILAASQAQAAQHQPQHVPAPPQYQPPMPQQYPDASASMPPQPRPQEPQYQQSPMPPQPPMPQQPPQYSDEQQPPAPQQ